MENTGRVWVIACLLLLLAFPAGSAQTPQEGTKDLAVTYQINAVHTGAINTRGVRPPLKVKWSVDLGGTVGYPLIAENKVFVIAGPDRNEKVNLYALDAASGNVLWGPNVIPEGAYFWAAAAYDSGMIFVIPNTIPGLSSGEIIAYSSATGQTIWTSTLGQYFFNAPPTAGNGMVYTGGAGTDGTVYAVRETDGNLIWTASGMSGQNSSPVVTTKGVYVSYVCPQSYKFNPFTGALIWHYSGPCQGGGGATPVLYKNSLYVRDSSRSNGHDGDILNATTGALVGTFDADFAPAITSNTAFYVQFGGLTAVNTTSGTTVWTASPGGDTYSTPPIVVNGVVYVGTASGFLKGYKAKTGKNTVSMNMGYPISASETGNVGSPESGLGAGQGILVVPASTHLIAMAH